MPSETILSPGAKRPTHLPKLEPPRKKSVVPVRINVDPTLIMPFARL